MVRRSFTAFLVAAATFACTGAVAGATPITACDNAADSALNQYCETVPGTGGSQLPGAVTRSLSSVLPHALVTRILGAAATPRTSAPNTRARAAALLALPAAQRVRTSQYRSPAAASVPLSTWAILIIVAIAIALAGGAALPRTRTKR